MRTTGLALVIVLGTSTLVGCGNDNAAATSAFCTALSASRTEAGTVAESLSQDLSPSDRLRQRRTMEQAADRLEDLAEPVSAVTVVAVDRAFDAFDDQLEDLAGSVEQRKAGAAAALGVLDAALNRTSVDTERE